MKFEMTKKEIQNIISSIRTAEGDFINSALPARLKENGFRMFFIDEKLLVLKSETEKYTLIINIRHELNDETGEFKMWISKPMYYSDIDMNPDTRDEARIYTSSVLEILSNKTFYLTLRNRLQSFDKQMTEFRKDFARADGEADDDAIEILPEELPDSILEAFKKLSD